MQIKLLSIAAALALAFAGSTYAQTTTPAKPAQPKVDHKAKKAEEDRIEADYKAAKAKCGEMKANEKDVCEADAKGKEKVAKAELDAKYANTERNQRKVDEAKAEHEYHVTKEKCDAEKGKQENACEKEAKAKYDRAKADIKARYATKDRKAAATGGTK